MKTLVIIGSAFFAAASVAGCAQKTIQKTINVEGGASALNYNVDKEYIDAKCLEISTSKNDFENILSNNGKVVIQGGGWSRPIRYIDPLGDELDAECYGQSYIVEGPESVLKDSK